MHKFMIVIFIFLTCSNVESKPAELNSDRGFSIYLLSDTLLCFDDISSIDINELELQKDPWIPSTDIAFYDYSTHFIYLKHDKQKYFNQFKRIYKDKEYFHLNGKPFVVVASGERIYIGVFTNMLSSRLYRAPTISDMSVMHHPSDVISIEGSLVGTDSKCDSRIKNALINSNLYHAGLRLELINIEVIENADTSTIQYSYTIYNEDEDDLYVLDPDLAGNKIFHYYTNGVSCFNSSGSLISKFRPPHNITDKSKLADLFEDMNKWDKSWFTKILSKESISRTITLREYPGIQNLKYECNFRFSTPNKIEKQKRSINGVRIWLGTITSNTVNIEIK